VVTSENGEATGKNADFRVSEFSRAFEASARSRRRPVVAVTRSVSPSQSSIACGVVRKSGTENRGIEKNQTPCVVSGFVEAIGGTIDLRKAFFFVSLLSRASNHKSSWNLARAA
jgi:hypothetical protein